MALRKSLSHLPGGMKTFLQSTNKNVAFNTINNNTINNNPANLLCRACFSSESSSSSSSTNFKFDPSEIYNHTENIKEMTNDELNDVTTLPGFTTLIHSLPKQKSSSVGEGATGDSSRSSSNSSTSNSLPTPRNALIGKVVSDKMQKTVNVAVDRYKIVPKYRKRKKYTKKFMAHDEMEVCNEGDLVMIVPCQRISRHKHFMVHEIIKKKGMF